MKEFDEGPAFANEDVRVRTVRVDHEPVADAFGFAVKDGAGYKAVFSGDTAYCPALVELARKATAAGITMSEYIRRVVTGTPVPVAGDHERIRDLLKVSADQARLGNALIFMIKEGHDIIATEDLGRLDLESLLDMIRLTQTELKAKAGKV